MPTQVYRARGQVTVPSRSVGLITATWPLGVLECTDDGIRVDFGPRLLKFFFEGAPAPAASGRHWAWRCSWDDLEHVLVAPLSMIFVPAGRRGCRFKTVRQRPLGPVVRMLESHGVPLEAVPSTWWRAFTL